MNKYPYLKVVLHYVILGSPLGAIVGSFLFTVLFFVSSLFKGQLLTFELLMIFGFSLIYGLVFSIVPALLSGIIIAVSKTYFDSKNRKIKTALIGFFVSIISIFIMLVSYIENSNNLILEMIPILTFASISGAISLFIIGDYILPKQPLQIRE